MRFDSGVSRYIEGKAIVVNYFPVDYKGNAQISCSVCRFFRRSSSSCALNDSICEYPNNYVGSNCPLEREEETDG